MWANWTDWKRMNTQKGPVLKTKVVKCHFKNCFYEYRTQSNPINTLVSASWVRVVFLRFFLESQSRGGVIFAIVLKTVVGNSTADCHRVHFQLELVELPAGYSCNCCQPAAARKYRKKVPVWYTVVRSFSHDGWLASANSVVSIIIRRSRFDDSCHGGS